MLSRELLATVVYTVHVELELATCTSIFNLPFAARGNKKRLCNVNTDKE